MRILTAMMCAMLILLSGCGGKEESGKPRVAASTEQIAWLLEQIAGDDIEIVTLIPPGSNPETYQPTVGTMKDLADASAYFTLGTPGFERKISRTVAENFPDILTADVSKGIRKVYGTHAETADSGDGFDPHMLTSLKNCIRAAETMTATLSEMFPEKKEEYADACATLTARLSTLDREISAKNLKGKAIVVRHPILTYFSLDYGINQIALEKEGKEPTPLQLSAQIDRIREAAPSIVVSEPTGNNSIERQVAEEAGIPAIEVNLSSDKWIEELTRTADEIDRN